MSRELYLKVRDEESRVREQYRDAQAEGKNTDELYGRYLALNWVLEQMTGRNREMSTK